MLADDALVTYKQAAGIVLRRIPGTLLEQVELIDDVRLAALVALQVHLFLKGIGQLGDVRQDKLTADTVALETVERRLAPDRECISRYRA